MPKHYRRVTEIFVGGLIGLALFYLLYHVAPPAVAVIVGLIGSFEGWTILNSRPHDTISEIIWKLKKRTLVPFLFGSAGVGMIALGWFGPDWRQAVLCAAWFMLQGHFFFTPEPDPVEEEEVPF